MGEKKPWVKPERKIKPLDKSVLTFFLISFPTLLIIIVGLIKGRFYWVVQIVLAIYQFVVLKQFIDNYYEIGADLK